MFNPQQPPTYGNLARVLVATFLPPNAFPTRMIPARERDTAAAGGAKIHTGGDGQGVSRLALSVEVGGHGDDELFLAPLLVPRRN